ncbi:hypothetical protein SEA_DREAMCATCHER_100 [Mycobacterium phage DreamCatcher]|nr:hypothetical protein SEA_DREAMCATCHER_100 [Mycobacterium phage DreamCatcher]
MTAPETRLRPGFCFGVEDLTRNHSWCILGT